MTHDHNAEVRGYGGLGTSGHGFERERCAVECGLLYTNLHAIERYATYASHGDGIAKRRLEGCLAGCFLVHMLGNTPLRSAMRKEKWSRQLLITSHHHSHPPVRYPAPGPYP